ncbi:hypothetical protein LSCM1_07566 [Leishmania martiniquensis]|uniref:Uncharacterized protein n=1 Tax=Leishmania martiniquensis TaxID=1580590 RepID=A0A836KSN7_9TRYP|nr:hypothetical protein LSCM1_07566 [Leishmania martiniquensis]
MKVSPEDPHRPPLATIPAFSNAGHATFSAPSSGSTSGMLPPSQSRWRHTTPPQSSAPLLAGMSPANMPFPAGWSTDFVSPTPGAVVTEAALESQMGDGAGDGEHQSAFEATSAAAVADTSTSDDILRGIYNEKLQASVRSIITTLAAELPQDHIFLQLMADPTTQQYCKVRLAEVVEGFLYSTQAEQYHALATELARGERDGALLRQRIEALEAELAAASSPDRLSTPQREGLASLGATSGIGENHAHQTVPVASSWTSRSPTMMRAPAAATRTTSSVSASIGANPMENEEARRELLRILEQATHDQELHRCTQALQAVSKVIDFIDEEAHYDDKYFFEGELLSELYKCIQSLLHYVDGALESQERLRQEIREQQRFNGATVESKRPADDVAIGDSVASAGNSASASASTKRSGTPAPVLASDYSTPRPPQVSLGNAGTALMSSVVASHFSSASSPAAADHTRPIQQQRERLQRLAGQLREGQQRTSELLHTLARLDSARRRELAQLERAATAAREEAAVAIRTAEGVRHAKENSERLCAERAASLARERTELRDQLADAHAQLAAATHDVHAVRRELRSVTTRAEEAEEREKDLAAELTARKAAMERCNAELKEYRTDCGARQAELAALRAAHQANMDALQDAARELLCVRVEGAMAGLSALYQEAKAAKAELLEREGYRPLLHRWSIAVAAQQEAARHAQVQSQLAESAQVEQAVAQRGCMDALGVLLRSMWADDATECALAPWPTSTAVDSTALHLPRRDSMQKAPRGGCTRRRQRTGSGGSTASGHTEGLGAEKTTELHCYRLPTTLAGMCNALECAYNNVRVRHRARQQTIDSLRAALVSKDIELRAAEASDAQLRELLKAEQAKEAQWKAEMAQLSEHNPMRDLLARQDALLKAVSDERNELRRLWNRLSGDYIALEQRNGVLHARCAEKEHENARLNGMLRRGGTSASPAGSRHKDATFGRAARGPAVVAAASSATVEVARQAPTLTVIAAQLGTSTDRPAFIQGLDSSSASEFHSTEAASNEVLA